MITLNDALTEIDNIWFKHSEKVDMQVLICKIFDQQDHLEQHIKSLEAQLANTEQLNCMGCFYYDKYEHFNYCDGCSRHTYVDSFTEIKDKFTKKDTK